MANQHEPTMTVDFAAVVHALVSAVGEQERSREQLWRWQKVALPPRVGCDRQRDRLIAP
jgi:hypothetical protein